MVEVRARGLTTAALLLIGFLLGYSVITEYPSVLIVTVLVLYALFRLQTKCRIGWTLIGGAVVGMGWMIYNVAIFGSPFELGYRYSELWPEQHQSGFHEPHQAEMASNVGV